jgi:predicted patatin/cPLA2 family phospholipase
MSLYDRARIDNAKILGSSRGFIVPVTFIFPGNIIIATRCFYIDVNLGIDANTGLPIVSRRVAISANKYSEDGITDMFPTVNPADTTGTIKFILTNNVGETKTYIAEKPFYDRTLAQYTMTGKLFTETLIPAPEPETP